jgi:hypothetical protein
MPHYYFHLIVGRERYRDELGVTFESLEAAYLDAFEAAREMWSELLKERRDPAIHSFEIANEDGSVLMILPFAEVLEAARKSHPAPAHTYKNTLKLVQKMKSLTQALNSEILRARENMRVAEQIIRRASVQPLT